MNDVKFYARFLAIYASKHKCFGVIRDNNFNGDNIIDEHEIYVRKEAKGIEEIGAKKKEG
jgi:hypothetical protein